MRLLRPPLSLLGNDIGLEGAKALGIRCRPELQVFLNDNLKDVFSAHRNKADLMKKFGSLPLKRFRLYLCGFAGKIFLFKVVLRLVCAKSIVNHTMLL